MRPSVPGGIKSLELRNRDESNPLHQTVISFLDHPLARAYLTGNSLASEQNGESESADVKEKQAEPSSDSKDSPLDPVNNQNETREDEDDDDEDEILMETESTNVAPPPTLIEKTEEVESKDEQTPQQPSAESQKSESEQTFEVNESAPESTPMKTLDVITIIGNQQKLQRASGSVSSSKKLLETQEHDDVHRVLKQVPGVYIRDEDGFGLRPNIGLRGASSDRSAKVSLMEDGVLMAPAPYAAPAAYYFPLTTRLSGMEVFKGPSAIKYGPNTIGGALNFTTRSSVPRGQRGEIDIAMGSYAQKVHAYFGQGARGFGYIIEGARIDSNGFKDLDTGQETGFQKDDWMLKGHVQSQTDGGVFHRLELKLGFAQERSSETYLGLTDEDFNATPYRRYAASQLGNMDGHAPKRNCITRDSLGRT